MKRIDQRGDTILEVLISVAVLSLILTTTFALANRNSQANRQAAERGEASKIAQQEIEKLKLYLASPGITLPDQGQYFCMNETATALVDLGDSGDVPATAIDANSDPSFQSEVYLKATTSNPDCREGLNDLYYKFIQRGTGPNNTTYTAYVRWPAATGNGVDQATIVHRINQDLLSTGVAP